MWQFPDQCSQRDSLNPVSPWRARREKRRLSQKNGGSLLQINCQSIDGFGSDSVMLQGHLCLRNFRKTGLREVSSLEILLAKTVSLRYIGFTCLIRYVGVRTL